MARIVAGDRDLVAARVQLAVGKRSLDQAQVLVAVAQKAGHQMVAGDADLYLACPASVPPGYVAEMPTTKESGQIYPSIANSSSRNLDRWTHSTPPMTWPMCSAATSERR